MEHTATAVGQDDPGRPNEVHAPSVKDRVGRLGSSDAAAILGLDPRHTALDVWDVVTGKREPKAYAGEEAEWGTGIEPIILGHYANRTSRVLTCGLFRAHPTIPFIGSHPDAIATRKGEEPRAVEAKNVDLSKAGDWAGDVPIYYIPQAVVHLACFQLMRCDFAVLVGGNRGQIVEWERRESLEEWVIGAMVDFMEHYVKTDTPPPPANIDEARRIWRKHRPGNLVPATDDVIALARTVKLARRLRKLADAAEDRASFALLQALPDAEAAVDGKRVIVSLKTNRAFDFEWLRREHPQTVEAFVERREVFNRERFEKVHPALAEAAMRGTGDRVVRIPKDKTKPELPGEELAAFAATLSCKLASIADAAALPGNSSTREEDEE